MFGKKQGRCVVIFRTVIYNCFMDKKNLILIIGIFVVVTLVAIFRGGGDTVNFDFTDTSLSVTGIQGYSYSVDYEDIDTVTFETLDDFGELINGVSAKKYTSGTFKNSRLGEYQFCGLTNLKDCMVIRTKDGRTYAANVENAASTEELCRSLNELLKDKGYK